MGHEMSSLERVYAALDLEEPDRVPLWIIGCPYMAKLAGIPYDEFCRDPDKIAKANLLFMEEYGADISYNWPDTWFTHEGWGMKMIWPPNSPPVPAEPLVKAPEDYEKLEVLDPRRDGRMPIILKSIEILSKEVGEQKAISTMQFAPLSFLAQIRGLVKSMQDLILFPDLVHAALRAITETVIEFFREAIRAGATVLLYHNAREDYSLLTKRQVEEFGWRYDSVVLKEIRRLGVPVVLHMCGPEPMIDLVIAEYPKGGFKGIQFWDRGSNINIREAKEKFGDKVCLVAGFDNVRTINFGSPGDVEREVEEAITAAGEGGGLIISSGCEIPPNAPEENVRAVARAVEKYGRYPLGKIRRL